jgi:hypothetical protein
MYYAKDCSIRTIARWHVFLSATSKWFVTISKQSTAGD